MSNLPVTQQPMTPMDLILKASQGDTSIEKMEQLFNLQLKWEENEAKKAYHQAVADFKAESIIILKDKQVSFDTSRGKTEYKHATLGNVVQLVVPFLSKHGLSHSWSIDQKDSAIAVTCYLTHVQGYSTKVTMSAGKDDSGGKNAIQQIASTVQYLERYTFFAITGLAAQDQDDDGKGATSTEVKIITEDQSCNLQGLMTEVKVSEKSFCSYWKIETVDKLPADKYEKAVKSLEAKRGA